MLKAIKFVRGAVAKKDLVPILTSFHIYKGRIQGYNGSVCIDHPLERTDLDFTIPAAPFIRAMDICDGEPEITVLENSRVKFSKGNFNCKIACEDSELFPVAEFPEHGWGHDVPQDFIEKLKLIASFISEDASRPWSLAVKIVGTKMYATNNIVIAETELEKGFNAVVLSSELVNELIRIGEKPISITYTDDETWFSYKNGAWIKGQTPVGEWPDIEQLFDFDDKGLEKIPHTLGDAINKLEHFAENGLIRFTEDGIFAGHEDDALVDGFKLDKVCFHVTPLQLVLNVAKSWDLKASPPRFSGDNIKGVICHVAV